MEVGDAPPKLADLGVQLMERPVGEATAEADGDDEEDEEAGEERTGSLHGNQSNGMGPR
jgi:hypothetical protein